MMKQVFKIIICPILAFIFINAEVFSQTTVVVNPSVYNIGINDTANVTVMINNVTNLHSASVLIKWNKLLVKYVNTVQGTFFPSGTFFGTQPSTAYVTDSVIVDQVILGPGNISGSGLLFTIKLKGLAQGTTPVTIAYADLRDPGNNPIFNTVSSGTINIGSSVNANLKIMLEGPFNGTTQLMNTALNTSGYLPLNQPYNQAPWNYTGTENVSGTFFSEHPDIVDWVMIEVRSGTGPTTVVMRKAGLLRSNGTIADHTTGNSALQFSGLSPGNYYIVINYASHLSVMSANPVTLSGSSVLYDFTTGTDKFYGGSAKQLSAGIFGLYAGDVDVNKLINASDKNLAYNNRGFFGYTISDVDRNGLVNASDKNLAYNNRGALGQVP